MRNFNLTLPDIFIINCIHNVTLAFVDIGTVEMQPKSSY